MRLEGQTLDDFSSEINDKIRNIEIPSSMTFDDLLRVAENAVNKKIEKENSAQKATAAGCTGFGW